MIKKTRNSIKFNKLLELIHKFKIKLLNTSYYEDIHKIDEQAKLLFEIYNNAKTLKQEVNIKIKNLAKQNSYLKYEHYIKKKGEEHDNKKWSIRL